jgi:Tfp pilus assembly pilus retraction ATPase PilT
MDITELLAFSVKNKASDLHLSAGLPPIIRVNGDVRRINLPAMEHKDVHAMVYDIMSDASASSTRTRGNAISRSRFPIWRVSGSTLSSRIAVPGRYSGRFRRRC